MVVCYFVFFVFLFCLCRAYQVPCDMVLLRTTEKTGASFIRTDQLDGETDWKLRYIHCSFGLL